MNMKHNSATTRHIRRTATALLTVAMLVSASSAWALNKDDVLRLQSSGLSPDLMVQVIRASTDPVTLTPAEVDELRAAGVAQPVLDELCMRIAGGCTPGAAVPGVGPAIPGVGPSLDAEMQRQQQLEQERLRMEQERLEAEAAAMRQRIAAEQAQNQQMTGAFQGLATADRAYDQGRYTEAAAAYNEFLTSAGALPSSAEYYEALCGFVRAMHARDYRYVIRSRALEAVLAGPSKPHFEEMFGILVDVSNDAQFLDPRFEELGTFPISGLSQSFQDEFNFFLGRYFWQYNDSTRAIALFNNISDGSPDKAKAHYLAASMLLNEQRNQDAYGQFEAAIRRASETGNAEVMELAYLALARIAYEVGQYDAALYYYQKVEDLSFRHPRAMFETMWAYFMKQDWERMLGAVHSLHSPYYAVRFWPDLYVVEAAAYLAICNLDEAEDTLLTYHDIVDPIREETNAFIATATPPDYWNGMTGYYDSLGTNDPIALPLETVRYVLSQAEFLNRLEFMGQLRMESALLATDAASLGTFGQQADTQLTSDLQTKEIEAGLEISMLVRSFAQELDEWNLHAQTVGIEISTSRIQIIDATMEGQGGGEAGSSVFVLAQDWQLWPFEGEYWLDEVDNFRGGITNYRSDTTGQCINPAFSANLSEE